MVQFDRVVEELPASQVIIDDYAAAYNAVSHLIEAGYTRIGHMAGRDGIALNRHRFEGYRDALRDHELHYEKKFHLQGGYREEDGRAGAQHYLSLDTMPDAILAINDPVAVGLFVEFRKAGLTIPNDIALVGFSGTPESAIIEPPLTTVYQPAVEMGRTAAALLMKQFQSEDDIFVPETTVLNTKQLIRGSSGAREA
jgi:LacI family transcriptional regulator